MPGFDGRGPRGQGPMTGRGGGFCLVPLAKQDKRRFAQGFAGSGFAGAGLLFGQLAISRLFRKKMKPGSFKE